MNSLEIVPSVLDRIRKTLVGLKMPRALARISHTAWCVGAANQRKLLCSNDLSPTRRAPRCRQSVARICLDSQLLKDAK
jgi:hypothetical protein